MWVFVGGEERGICKYSGLSELELLKVKMGLEKWDWKTKTTDGVIQQRGNTLLAQFRQDQKANKWENNKNGTGNK